MRRARTLCAFAVVLVLVALASTAMAATSDAAAIAAAVLDAETALAAGDQDARERAFAAVKLAERAVDDRSLAGSLLSLGDVCWRLGLAREAESALRRAARLAEGDEERAWAELSLGRVLHARGALAEAQELLERARARDPVSLTTRTALAMVLADRGSFDAAERLLSEILADPKREPCERATVDSFDACVRQAQLATELAIVRHDLGRTGAALAAARQAEGILGELAAANYTATPSDAREAAALRMDASQPDPRAGLRAPPGRRVIRIYEVTIQGVPRPEYGATLNNLGALYLGRGESERAERLLALALEADEGIYPAGHPDVARDLANLGHARLERGEAAQARVLLERALAMAEATEGASHPDVARILATLASVRIRQGELAAARVQLERALAILEAAGASATEVAAVLGNLAVVAAELGLADQAELWHARAYELRRRALGHEHPLLARTLYQWARAALARGDTVAALDKLERADALRAAQIEGLLDAASESQKRRVLAALQHETDLALAIVHARPTDPRARRAALAAVVLRKGRALESLTDALAARRRRATAETAPLFSSLAAARADLASLLLDPSAGLVGDRYAAAVSGARARVETLEAQLATGVASAPPASIDAIAASLAAGEAAVEIVRHRSFRTGSAIGQRWGDLRYTALSIDASGEVRIAELGDARSIDDRVAAFRAALADPRRDDTAELGRALDRTVGAPIRRIAGGARTLLIAPDGALSLVPFEAFVTETGAYFGDQHVLGYLSTSRELLRAPQTGAVDGSATVVGDPDFGAGGGEAPVLRVAPLPGARAEAEAVGGLLNAHLLLGASATRAAVLDLSHPSVLHLATHGLFRVAAGEQLEGRRGVELVSFDAVTAQPAVGDGMSRSGLLFAGQRGPEVVSALELAGLDLAGTRLVVLSACDSGVGEVDPGEGVYGLRRAFALAGAETVVMSLWKVEDGATRDLMIELYRGLLAGERRLEALRDAKRTIRAQPGRSHPFFWASFIAAGERGDLWGRRRVPVELAPRPATRGCACDLGRPRRSAGWLGALLLVLVLARRGR